VALETSLSPLELLAEIRRIEFLIDPERNSRGRKLARKIDIDILWYGDLVLNSEELVIPHPRMKERDFVMKPLREIAPHVIASEAKHSKNVTDVTFLRSQP
jgi:2-amino-4-hydroxy-6-hydroxymethyldihydropteridine diphosphokinase